MSELEQGMVIQQELASIQRKLGQIYDMLGDIRTVEKCHVEMFETILERLSDPATL